MATISFILLAIFLTFVSSNNDRSIVQIINSGSTNTAGYVIDVHRNGLVTWNVASRHHLVLSTTASPSTTTAQNSIQFPEQRTNSIFQAVEQAVPLNQYAPIFCVKSVSFGTSLYVVYDGQQSPDISCPLKDQRLVILSKYVHELIADLHINTLG